MTETNRGSPELGNAVFFDHINLAVTDHRLATLFYVEGLGLTRDPYRMTGTANMWVNVGTQQFHLPVGEARPFVGEIGIAVPNLAEVTARFSILASDFAGTHFAMGPDGETLRLRDPWGRGLRVIPAGSLPGRNPLALPYIEFVVEPGRVAGIAEFYRQVLGAPVEADEDSGPPCITVTVGPWQFVRFRESAQQPSRHALHICLYVTRFWEFYERIRALGIPVEEVANEQFRFRDILAPNDMKSSIAGSIAGSAEGNMESDIKGGDLLYSIEHEIRSVAHLDYRRPLVNRTAMPNEPGYMAPLWAESGAD